MGKANELIIILVVFTKTSDGNGHSALKLAVELGLGHIVFYEVVKELLGCAGKLKLLRSACELFPFGKNFV